MADRLDAVERLAEGRPAVEYTQRYVRACQVLGYRDPDLTAHASQVRDWYESEDGLDLRVLDSDCVELRSAAAAVSEALGMQRAQIGALSAAWTGAGADSAIRFLQRHCDAADVLCADVRAAAQRCESLRDNLWQLIDGKVTTAIDIDDRTQTQRPAWLAAADAVTTGAGDRSTADEIIRGQINPYVDNDIRIEWLTAMRWAQARVAASYDTVIDRLATARAASFEIPGDLGPGGQPLQQAPPHPTTAPAAAVAPVAALPGHPPNPASPSTSVPPPPGLPQAAQTPGLGPLLGDGSAMAPAAGSGLNGLSGLSGLSGLANRIVEAMGGLLGSGADGLPDPSAFDEGMDDEADHKPDAKTDEAEDGGAVDDAAKAKRPVADGTPPADQGPPADRRPAADQPAPAAPVAQPVAPLPAKGPPAIGPPPGKGPPPPSPSGGSTPCEIAADELPQAGQ